MFSVSKLYLIQQLNVFSSIRENFFFDRIPTPETRVDTFYYDDLVNEIMYGTLPDKLSGRDFLNDAAFKVIPDDFTLNRKES